MRATLGEDCGGLFAIVHGSMAGPAAYTRLAEEVGRRGQRTLLVGPPVDRPEFTGTEYAAWWPSSWVPA